MKRNAKENLKKKKKQIKYRFHTYKYNNGNNRQKPKYFWNARVPQYILLYCPNKSYK